MKFNLKSNLTCNIYSMGHRHECGCNRFNKLDARSVPTFFKNLTFMEKRFLARTHVFMTILSLPAGGQYAQDGLCINFPVNFQELFQDLDMKTNQQEGDIIIVHNFCIFSPAYCL